MTTSHQPSPLTRFSYIVDNINEVLGFALMFRSRISNILVGIIEGVCGIRP